MTLCRLVNDADEFARATLSREGSQISQLGIEGADGSFEHQRIFLRTAFLFPSLSRWQQGLFVTVYWHRLMLSVLLKLNQQDRLSPLGNRIEQMTSQAEQAFMHLKTQALEIVQRANLTPLQRRVLDEEYLEIRFG